MGNLQYHNRQQDNSGNKGVEIYLPEDMLAKLDALALECGMSRDDVIARLIGAQSQMAPTEARSKSYTWSEAKGKDGFDWFIILHGDPIAGVKRDDVNGWRGKYLQCSMAYKWAKGETPDKVAFMLLDAPSTYR